MINSQYTKWSSSGAGNMSGTGGISANEPSRGLSAAATMSSQFLNRRKVRQYRTLSMVCDEEPLSDIQLKILHQRNQEYQNFMELMSRLASSVNVCLSEESVIIGDNGLLTAESLNALQHSGAISVYNTLQSNDWKYPLPDEGEMVVSRPNWSAPEDPSEIDKILKSDTPALHLSECLVDGDQTELLGGIRPLRGLLPPTLVFRNVSEMEDEAVFDTQDVSQPMGETALEIVSTSKGLAVKKPVREGKVSSKETLIVPLDEYYYDRTEGSGNYREEKGEYRFRCHVCNKMLYSNIKLMFHMMSHIDEQMQPLLTPTGMNQCTTCFLVYPTPFAVRQHVEDSHPGNMACRICEKDLGNENALRRHMQATHRHREMPYICQLCFFRTSLYEDVLDHFKKVHEGSSYLLCVYCLRVFKISFSSAQTESGFGVTGVFFQHLQKHQQKQLCRRCNACRLQFVNKSDCHIHRQLDHKAGPPKETESRGVTSEISSALPGIEGEINSIAEDVATTSTEQAPSTETDAVVKRLNVTSSARDLTGLVYPENTGKCVECGDDLTNVGHSQYIPCTDCRFASCCSAAYARHQTTVHGSKTSKETALVVPPPTLDEPLYCPSCGFGSNDGNELAKHMVTQCSQVSAVMTRPEIVHPPESKPQKETTESMDVNADANAAPSQENIPEGAEVEEIDTATVLVESTDEHGTGTVTTVTLGSQYTVLVESGEEGEAGVAQPTAMRLLQADDGGLMLVSEDGQLVVPVGPSELEMIKQQDEAAGQVEAEAAEGEGITPEQPQQIDTENQEPAVAIEEEEAAEPPHEEEMLVVEMDQDSGAPGMLLYENPNTESEKENLQQ